MLQKDLYLSETTPEMKDNFEKYLSKEWKYFGHTNYFENNLALWFDTLETYSFVLSSVYFSIKKKLLDYQEDLYTNSKTGRSQHTA